MKHFLFLIIFYSVPSWAYPDFIGYGYKNCIMCHYSSKGGGSLTDYGRALYSQEISARNFWTPTSKSDEEVAEKDSGFIPGVQRPWWISPSVKFRGLWFRTNPNGNNSVARWIDMQREINLVFSADEASRTILVLNYGLLAKPEQDYYGDGKKIDAASREHYLRFYLTDKLLVSTGLMDKAYGLHIPDHTSFSRSAIGLGQDDQVHGLLLHWMDDEWDASLHLYTGNLFEPAEIRKSGGAIQFEYALSEKDQLGFSLLTEKNSQIDSKRFAIHNRWGFPKAKSSILFELGLKQDQATASEAKLGSYAIVQSLINIVRGYNFLTVFERSQSEFKFSSAELQRWTFGFLMYPIHRTEFRITAVQNKNFSPAVVSNDQWQLQGQVHVSF